MEFGVLTLWQDPVQTGQLLWKLASFFGSLWGKILVHPQDNIPLQHNKYYLACQCGHYLFVCLAQMHPLSPL